MFKLFKKKSKWTKREQALQDQQYLVFSANDTFKELSSFSIFFSSLTKQLLHEKGFEANSTPELTAKRIALLHTEVSELVDAEKKGYSAEDKAMELADIIIRLLNIPVMYPAIYDGMKRLQDLEDSQYYNAKYYFSHYNVSNEEINGHLKMRIANDMHATISLLENALFDYRIGGFEETQTKKELIIKLIFDVILQCQLYIKISAEIQGKLHEFVHTKMELNFQRPHRYNTSPNF